MRYYHCYLLKLIKERESDQELGRIAQDIVAIDLKLCGHKILEYNLVGKSDIETEFEGIRYVFQVKSSKRISEINVKKIKEDMKAKVGRKRLIFVDLSFPVQVLCFNLDYLPDESVIPVFEEDNNLSEILNRNLPEAIRKYYEFYNQYKRADHARILVKKSIGVQ